MKKPKNYHLEKKDNRFHLDITCHENDGTNYLKRQCFLNSTHGYELTPKTAKSLGLRLLKMAEWLDGESK